MTTTAVAAAALTDIHRA